MLILMRIILVLLTVVTPVMANQEVTTGAPAYNALDTLWVLVAAVLVFFMQAGFAMVEAGLVRAKNAANVLTKNLIDFCIASLAFFVFGYAIMFGGDGPVVGTSGWFLSGARSAADGIPMGAFWLFEAVFAGTAATIVSGAVAERIKFVAYLAYSFLITAFIYPVVGHWIWGGGWLAQQNFHDFAGSLTVHAVGGMSALVGAWVLGPRFGRFNKDGSPNAIGGHSLPLMCLGVFILWFGWYGFNAGSTLRFSDPELVSRIALTTTLAGATGSLLAMVTAWALWGKPDLTLALNGVLAGLVGITASCAVVSPGASIFVGAIAGVLVVFGVRWLNHLQIDDPVGAIPVHLLCGIWGTLAVGLWGQKILGSPADGLFYGGGFGQLGIQSLGIVACLGFVGLAMLVIFKAIDSVVGLRVSHMAELKGLDSEEHGLESYSGFQIFLND